jgi:hypothetical protein
MAEVHERGPLKGEKVCGKTPFVGKGGGRRRPLGEAGGGEVQVSPRSPRRAERKAYTSSTMAGCVGKSGRRRLILRWPEFSTLDFGQLGTEKTKKNMNMEANGARFRLRKNSMDVIGMEHTG